jgi:PLP dependent protein
MNESPSISENLRIVRERIAAAAIRSGRAPSDITLVAVSKTRPAEHVLQVVEAGQRDFGENYVQEARDKMGSLPVELRWHFIGHLQTNKAKYVVGRYALVHGVDRLELATELGKRALTAGVVQPVLIEVRLDPADTKGGADPEKALALAEVIGSIPGLGLRGLMGMPPFFADPNDARPFFARLRDLFDTLPPVNQQVLSMGMSGDFEVAIEEGATMVRVGTAIFGRRGA